MGGRCRRAEGETEHRRTGTASESCADRIRSWWDTSDWCYNPKAVHGKVASKHFPIQWVRVRIPWGCSLKNTCYAAGYGIVSAAAQVQSLDWNHPYAKGKAKKKKKNADFSITHLTESNCVAIGHDSAILNYHTPICLYLECVLFCFGDNFFFFLNQMN